MRVIRDISHGKHVSFLRRHAIDPFSSFPSLNPACCGAAASSCYMKKETMLALVGSCSAAQSNKHRRLPGECGCGASAASLLCFLSLFAVVFGSLASLHVGGSLSLADLFFVPSKTAADAEEASYGGAVWHSMSDEELLVRAAEMLPCCDAAEAKVAFMFLTRGRLPLRPLWERFFRGHAGLFSIYVHASPEFREEPPEDSVFYNRRVPSRPVEWGRWSMVEAERRLLANALLDPSNARFVLLSESCIPLFDLPTVRAHLLASPLSFVASFDDPRRAGRGRYSRLMLPIVALADWRKGSQWFELHRHLATAVVADRRYWPVFRDHCLPPCYPDEHYVPTLVTKLFPLLNANWSITWVDWSRGGSHPATYRRRDVSLALLQRMRSDSRCVGKKDDTSNSICFLFARKFEAATLTRLLLIADATKHLDWP